jgi:hypothetical protein
MLPAFGYKRHDFVVAQRLFELNTEAIAFDPADDPGQFEILAFEQQSTADRRWRRGTEHRAALRYVEQHAIGLAVDREEGARQHDAMPAIAPNIGFASFTGTGHRTAHAEITYLSILSASQIITNESLNWGVRDRFFDHGPTVLSRAP